MSTGEQDEEERLDGRFTEVNAKFCFLGYTPEVHVAKPVEPSELIATVASVTGRTGAAYPG